MYHFLKKLNLKMYVRDEYEFINKGDTWSNQWTCIIYICFTIYNWCKKG